MPVSPRLLPIGARGRLDAPLRAVRDGAAEDLDRRDQEIVDAVAYDEASRVEGRVDRARDGRERWWRRDHARRVVARRRRRRAGRGWGWGIRRVRVGTPHGPREEERGGKQDGGERGDSPHRRGG